jgi:hypothetical protein
MTHNNLPAASSRTRLFLTRQKGCNLCAAIQVGPTHIDLHISMNKDHVRACCSLIFIFERNINSEERSFGGDRNKSVLADEGRCSMPWVSQRSCASCCSTLLQFPIAPAACCRNSQEGLRTASGPYHRVWQQDCFIQGHQSSVARRRR